MVRVYFEVHGCAMSRADAEIMMALLREAGHEVVPSPEESDVAVLVTCNVKKPTEDRMVFLARKLSSSRPLVAAGCMVVTQPYLLRPYASAMVGPHSLDSIARAVRAAASGRRFVDASPRPLPKASMPRVRTSRVTAIVPIAEGCLGSCTYCIVRLARGRLRSFPPGEVVSAVRRALSDGAVEIFLTAQDTGVYGRDIGSSLPGLLRAVSSIGGSFRVRVGMATPSSVAGILRNLLEAYSDERVYKFFHLPVQSGSDSVLRDMGRPYTASQFRRLVREIRSAYEDSTLATDVIVGFPTEGEEDFEATLRLLEDVKPDVVNLSRYAPRPGTPAWGLGSLPPEVVKRRSREAHELITQIKLERNERYVGREARALVVEEGRGARPQARTDSYRPVVVEGDVKLGRFYEVLIEEARSHYLVGRAIREL